MFDLDGTLVDTLDELHAALALAMRALGRAPVPREAVGHMVGKGADHLVRSALVYPRALDAGNTRADNAPDFQALRRSYGEAYEQLNATRSRVFPGVMECLQTLHAAGLPLACLTNKPVRLARQMLASYRLDAFFAQVFGGDSFARRKPDPLPLLETCRALGVAPERALMVGDSSNDAGAARAAGSAVVLVSYGYNHGRPIHELDVDACVESLAELPALLGLPAGLRGG